jgi:phosphatidylinositol alpha-1,6-mannosyltransferase
LALVTDAFGGRGGIAQYNRDLLAALAASGTVDEVVVLTRQAEPGVAGPPGVVQLPGRPSRLAFVFAACSLALRRKRFDVIFCGHLFMMPLAAVLGRFSGKPVWLQLHGIEAWERPGRVLRWAAEQASLVTAVSRYTRTRFLAWAGVAPESVKVLPNTVEERFAPGPKPEGFLARHGLLGRKVLLTVSRLSAAERYKGHEQVLRALAKQGGARADWAYVVAGDGDDRARLERAAQALGVSQLVRFIGHVPDSELPDVFRAADVFVMPSSGEGFGIVFLQALACGIPVISGDADGSRDPMQDGRNGLLVPPGDVDALACALDAVLERGHAPAAAAASAFDRRHFAALAARLATRFQA